MPELHPARPEDLSWLVPAALQARVIERADDLSRIMAQESWRVQVTDRGEAAILERWREHSNDCAVLGIWCSARRVPVLICELERIAGERGFERLIGPLVPEDAAQPYLKAGMRVAERVDVMRLSGRAMGRLARDSSAEPAEAVAVRLARTSDIPRIVDVDAQSFDDFWRYDARLVTRLASSGLLLVAEKDSVLIGYTLATVHGADASLGRLAVIPGDRRHGIGRALAREAIRRVSEQGAKSVVLSTQEGNSEAQALYRSLGFERVPGHLMVCVSGPLS